MYAALQMAAPSQWWPPNAIQPSSSPPNVPSELLFQRKTKKNQISPPFLFSVVYFFAEEPRLCGSDGSVRAGGMKAAGRAAGAEGEKNTRRKGATIN